MNRRAFIHAGLAALAIGCQNNRSNRRAALNPVLAFNTANLVARFSNYRFDLNKWGDQHRLTVARTDEAAWAAICAAIAQTGFRTVEIWEAHASPETMSRARATAWNNILADHGLKAIGYAGGLRRETVQVCQWLNLPFISGSNLHGLKPADATALCRASGIAFNLENHPEKTVEEILAKIGGGNDWLGVCVDTGWLGTQGADAPAAIRRLGTLVRHTHIKDVKAAGAHQTCLLGEGVVRVADCLAALQAIHYRGIYAWEDEPEDRNPLPTAARNRQWIERHLTAA